jgi:hypothetical protein
VKNTSCNVWTKRAAQFLVVFAFLLVFLVNGCNTISPRLQDEYIRPGLSPGMCGIFDKYRQSIPKIMAEDKVPKLTRQNWRIKRVDNDPDGNFDINLQEAFKVRARLVIGIFLGIV